MLADLRRAGLVETRRGVGGGVVLARPAARITLRAVWEALEAREQLFARHPSGPNPHCPVGRCVAAYLEELYGEAEAALKASLGKVTLAQLQRDVASRLPPPPGRRPPPLHRRRRCCSAEFRDGLCQFVFRKRFAVPAVFVRQKADAVAFFRARDDGLRLALCGHRAVQRRDNRLRIVSVNRFRLPAL